MKSLLRDVAGIFVGFLVVFVLLIAVEGFSNVVHPFPKDFAGTKEEICRHVEKYPDWVLAVCVPMWAGIAFVGTWIANWIGNRFSAAILGLLVVAALCFNISMLPYPIWFKIVSPIVIPVAAIAGIRRSVRPKAVAATEAEPA